MITSAPPEFILTDDTGVLIATSGSTASILSTSGASTGDVLTVQGDGTLDFATPVVTESLTDLDEWAANTLTVPGALTVRQAGGVAGTDEIQIYHDGSDAYISPKSGNLNFGTTNLLVNGDLTVNDRISSSSTKLNLSQGGTDRIIIEGGIVQINQGTLRKRSTIGYLGAITHPWNTFFTEEMLLMYDFNSSSDYEALSVNGTAGEITLTAQSLGTGSSNIDISLNPLGTGSVILNSTLTVRQPGGVAGTDEVQIYHDGTDAHVDAQSGDLIFNNSNAKVNSSGEFTNNQGYSGCETYGIGATLNSPYFMGTSIGYYSQVGSASVAVGSYTRAGSGAVAIGAGFSTSASNRCYAADDSIAMGYQAQANYSKSIALQSYAKTTDYYQFVTKYIRDVYIGTGVTSAVPYDTTYHATGGSGTDISGANLILAGGKPTGAGTSGQVQFQVAPSGASGTTLGTLTTVGLFDEQGLTVRQPGGVAGTDELQIYHDGSSGYIASQSGDLVLKAQGGGYCSITIEENANGNDIKYKTGGVHAFYEDTQEIWQIRDGSIIPSIGKDGILGALQSIYGGAITRIVLGEKSVDPSDPDEGRSCIWQSDGTGSGDDGDIMVKITAGGVTKTATLIDFSAV